MPERSLLANVYGVSALLIHPDGDCLALVLAAVGMGTRVPLEECFVTFLSPFAPGYALYTSSGRPRFDPLPGNEGSFLQDAAISELLIRHRQSLAAARSRRTFLMMGSPEKAREYQISATARLTGHLLMRGVWERMTDVEVDALRERLSRMPIPPIPPELP